MSDALAAESRWIVGLSGRDCWGGCEPVTAHHFAELGRIGRAARRRGEDLCDVSGVRGSEPAGVCDREELGIDAAAILEPVDLPAPDTHRVAGVELTRLAVDGVQTPSKPKLVSSNASWLCGMGTFASAGTAHSNTVRPLGHRAA